MNEARLSRHPHQRGDQLVRGDRPGMQGRWFRLQASVADRLQEWLGSVGKLRDRGVISH
jgi:hypothetical protein